MFNPPCVIRYGSHTAILLTIGRRYGYLIEMKAGKRSIERISIDKLEATWSPMVYDVVKAATAFAEKICTSPAKAALGAIIQGTTTPTTEEGPEMAYDPSVPTTPAAAKASGGKVKATPAAAKPEKVNTAKPVEEKKVEDSAVATPRRRRRRRGSIPGISKITNSAAQRAYVTRMREGSKRREMMELIHTCKTVDDAVAAGVPYMFILFAKVNEIATFS